ncbi:MAG: DUF3570 domain-containing protein [Planctomycetes bacterium]|nr:DUF3570 domain-containing protein [Planctomycetota bacterium]
MLLSRWIPLAAALLGLALSPVPLRADESSAGAVPTGTQPRTASPTDGLDPTTVDPGGEQGHGQLGLRIGYYDADDSGDGNPFVDESLTVVEPVILFSTNVTDRSTLWGKFSYDDVSSASIERLSNYATQSGASGDDYFGLDLGWKRKLQSGDRFGLFGHFSSEYDYQSIGLGGDYSFDLANKNATVQASLSGFLDSIDVIRSDGRNDGSDDRLSLASTVTWTQIMSPRTHGTLGVTVGHQDGFLETPYNPVVIEDSSTPIATLENARGTQVDEELPDTRTRVAIFGRSRTSLSERTAVELGGRIYSDTWGISSITIEPRFYFWWVPEKLRTRVRYRFYVQTEADDYSEHFYVLTSERTQDSDLAAFDSHTVGIQLVWSPTTALSFDISGDYVLRSDGLDQIIASIGWLWNF